MCTVYKKSSFLQQAMREFLSGTTHYVRAMKSYDKIIIIVVPSYSEKIMSLLLLALLLVLPTHYNTDGHKLVRFSDTYSLIRNGT